MSAAAAEQPFAAHAAPSPAVANIIHNKICPVTGEPNGSMGDSIPVTVDGQTLYVCCRGCVKKVKAVQCFTNVDRDEEQIGDRA